MDVSTTISLMQAFVIIAITACGQCTQLDGKTQLGDTVFVGDFRHTRYRQILS
jgi:hypothetical protein